MGPGFKTLRLHVKFLLIMFVVAIINVVIIFFWNHGYYGIIRAIVADFTSSALLHQHVASANFTFESLLVVEDKISSARLRRNSCCFRIVTGWGTLFLHSSSNFIFHGDLQSAFKHDYIINRRKLDPNDPLQIDFLNRPCTGYSALSPLLWVQSN